MKRLAGWLVGAALALLGFALLVPGSPAHVSNWIVPRTLHNGKSASDWAKDLKSPDAEVRRNAIFSLGTIGHAAADAVPALGAIAADDAADDDLRNQAVLALSKMAPASSAALADLIKVMDHHEDLIRMNAAFALLRLGPLAKAAVPTLLKALTEERNQTSAGRFRQTIQEIVILALGRTSKGSADAVPALVEALEKAPSPQVRIMCVRALGDIGPEAKPAVPLLQRLLQGYDKETGANAEQALKKIEES